MDESRFDAVTRRLGGASSRREVVTGLAGGLLAALGIGRAASAAMRPATVTICHWDADRGAYEQLTISEQGLNGHGRHAEDLLDPDFTSAATCGDCNTVCSAGETCTDGACVAVSTCSPETCPSPCLCLSSVSGIFCYSGRFPAGLCQSDSDCPVAGSSCQGIDGSGFGFCRPIGCEGNPEICPAGSQCTAGVTCQELCTAA